MNDYQDCQQRYCCMLDRIRYCTNHCIRYYENCIRCIIRNTVQTTDGAQCRFCHHSACCYISVNTGIFQPKNSYRITRFGSTHSPIADCECSICHEHHEPERYHTELFSIPINHPSIIVQDGYPEAQASSLECDGYREVNDGREEALRQVTSEDRDPNMVPGISTEARTSGRENQTHPRVPRARRG